MYKIYIGKLPVFLTNSLQEVSRKNENALILEYDGEKKGLLNQIECIEAKHKNFSQFIIVSKDVEQLKEDFFAHYKIRKAGGGVVYNAQNKILAIYRRNHWDLPKGKQEKGEIITETALREVQEETGVEHLTLGDFVTETFHTYRNRKGKRCIKWVYWYKMYTTDEVLTPQAEEDIEEAVWLSKEQLLSNQPIYENIKNVLYKL